MRSSTRFTRRARLLATLLTIGAGITALPRLSFAQG